MASATGDTNESRLEAENRVLRVEVEALKLRVQGLMEDNKSLRRASVSIQARAEQEEEFISNTLLKKIETLKKEKETLALNFEQEEECLTNDLSRKLTQLRQEKTQLERTLEHEQEALVNKLMRRIERLENETLEKQQNLDQLRREKVELENTLEQEQEALVNRLWKKMDRLEAEKRLLLGESGISPPANDALSLGLHVQALRGEVNKLKAQLMLAEKEHAERMRRLEKEEKEQRDTNERLQKQLQLECERRSQLCKHLSESESSLDEHTIEERIQIGACPTCGHLKNPNSPDSTGGMNAE